MKYNCCTLDLCGDTSARKYFRVLIDALGDQVSPIEYLFLNLLLLLSLISTYQDFHQNVFILYINSFKVSLVLPCFVTPLKKSDC